MIPTNRTPTHAGKILKEEFLDELGVSQVAFSAHIKVPVQRINETVRGKRGITPEPAWLLAHHPRVLGQPSSYVRPGHEPAGENHPKTSHGQLTLANQMLKRTG